MSVRQKINKNKKNKINPLTPESMLSEVKERLEGPKYNIDFGGEGWR